MKLEKAIISENKINILKTDAGITLVELLVALVVMSIAMSAIFGIYMFTTKTFKASQINSKNQFEVRMAADFITKELRYATTIQVLTTPPIADTIYSDIYLQSGSIKYYKKGVLTVPPGLNNVTDFEVIFSSASNVISFTVGKSGTTNYDLSSSVKLLNIPSPSLISTTLGIRYQRQ